MYDLIIVGAGSAGCVAAKVAAEKGLNVCLIDRKSSSEIGRKVCGDGIGKHHFDNLNMAYPSGRELANIVRGFKIYSPDRKSSLEIEGSEGFILNRWEFGQRLLKEAISKGASLLSKHVVLGPIIEEGVVKGVIAKDLKKGEILKIRSKITIDASGFSACLRNKLPSEFGFEYVNFKDTNFCYREIRSLTHEVDPEYCYIYLNQDLFPGGYCWIFPRGKYEVNVGVGVQMKEDHPNPKKILYEHVFVQPIFKGSRLLHGGGGIVPTRRPLDKLVANGFMIIGDSACMTNPIHGGGIGPSMMSGRLSAEVAVESIERGDVSEESLWQYPIRYMKSYGAKQAGLDVFRLFLQSLNNDDLNYGIKQKILEARDILETSLYGEVRIGMIEKLRRIVRGLGRISLLRRLSLTIKFMKEIKRLYTNYPRKEDFNKWRAKCRRVYEEAKRLVGHV